MLASRNRLIRYALLAPPIAWIGLFLYVPLMAIVVFSFLRRGPTGELLFEPTLANYVRLLETPVYLDILWRSIQIGFLTTFVVLFVAYPVAYLIARRSGRTGTVLLLLILVPFWTSYLVRILAWLLTFLERGALNWALQLVGLPAQHLLFTPIAVIVGISYSLLPFGVLPIYAVLRNQDRTLVDAATVLGASRTHAFWEVTLPLSMPGVIAATLLMLIVAMANFLAPAILGGRTVAMFSNTVRDVAVVFNDIPFAAALMVVMLVVVLFLLFITTLLLRRLVRVR